MRASNNRMLFTFCCMLLVGALWFVDSSKLIPEIQAQRSYEFSTPVPNPDGFVCGEACEVDSDCQTGYCYQFVCPIGQNCQDVYQGKTCRNFSCPSSSSCSCTASTPTPTPTPTPSPTNILLACNANCVSDEQCQTGFCYQPPMPTCPPGLNCAQVMPQKVCRNQKSPTSLTCDTDQIEICRADLNMDTIVDLGDYAFMIRDFFKTIDEGASARNDFNDDKFIDLSDYSMYYPILNKHFFATCDSMISIPTM